MLKPIVEGIFKGSGYVLGAVTARYIYYNVFKLGNYIDEV